MMYWASELIGRLMYNCGYFFGFTRCAPSSEDDFVEPDRPAGKCAEITYSLVTYLLTVVSLATVGTAAMRVSIVGDIEDIPVPVPQSAVRYLLPAGVFVYSFIFSLDRRPSQLVKLFLGLAEVRAILTKEKDPVHHSH